jgi:O-acetyl-ADP-ribose deacetylase (regulator of RNase III)
MIKYIDGDLLKFSDEGIFDVIAHCCNCFCNFVEPNGKKINTRSVCC